jgi:hypothetical protein
MFYLIQNSNEERYPAMIEALEKLGLGYEVCKYRPFIYEIDFTTNRKDVWCFGAYDLTGLHEKYGFYPGQMSNSNHDFEVYAPKYGMENMLNGNCIIMNFSDPLPEDEKWDLFFARPTIDKKTFTAKVYDREEWNKYVNGCKENGTIDIVTNDTKVVISTPKNIQQEIRCWVVGGKIITISQYKIGRRVTSKNLDHDQEAIDFAQKMVDKYQLAESFVIDICRTTEGFKIVEAQCINACGFYQMDCEKLLLALEKHFNGK